MVVSVEYVQLARSRLCLNLGPKLGAEIQLRFQKLNANSDLRQCPQTSVQLSKAMFAGLFAQNTSPDSLFFSKIVSLKSVFETLAPIQHRPIFQLVDDPSRLIAGTFIAADSQL